jgi:hypothetical protein
MLVDALLFGTTNATKASSFMVMVGFLLLSATFYYLIYGLIKLSGYYGLRIKNKRSLALYISGVTGALIALQSVGQLGPRDFLILLPLLLIGYFYSAYAKKASV